MIYTKPGPLWHRCQHTGDGMLDWLWGRSGQTVPNPGFRTVMQVEENPGGLEFGPLEKDQMQKIETNLERSQSL
jgi:aryl-alcohol dehydrogenase-like predicted oxidoreductase